jgi:hypothetical protein
MMLKLFKKYQWLLKHSGNTTVSQGQVSWLISNTLPKNRFSGYVEDTCIDDKVVEQNDLADFYTEQLKQLMFQGTLIPFTLEKLSRGLLAYLLDKEAHKQDMILFSIEDVRTAVINACTHDLEPESQSVYQCYFLWR